MVDEKELLELTEKAANSFGFTILANSEFTSLPGPQEKAIKELVARASSPKEPPSPVLQALPTVLATFGAALLGASAEKGSPLRLAGAVPGIIDAAGKALDEKKDAASAFAIPIGAAAVGFAAPLLIK